MIGRPGVAPVTVWHDTVTQDMVLIRTDPATVEVVRGEAPAS
jgi:hypothetical protein